MNIQDREISLLAYSRQMAEILAWRIVAGLSHACPDKLEVRGHYDEANSYCLRLQFNSSPPESFIEIQRDGLVVSSPSSRRAYYDWVERMLMRPKAFLEALAEDMCVDFKEHVSGKSTATLNFNFITECLSHGIGQSDVLECRCGDDESYGRQDEWFRVFQKGEHSQDLTSADPSKFWFILRNAFPKLCIHTDGKIFTGDRHVYQVRHIMAMERSMWHLVLNLPASNFTWGEEIPPM